MNKLMIAAIVLISMISFLFGVYFGTGFKVFNENKKKDNRIKTTDTNIKFIWNDDEESIPKDGSLVLIEFTDEDVVYIGPATDVKFKFVP